MSGYIGTQPVPQATQTRDSFTCTAGQTVFATGGYTPQFLDVFLNGIHLLDGTDYTATNGSDVVLTTGAATDDVLEVVSYTPFEVADQTFTGDTSVDSLSVTGTFTSQGIDDNATSTAMTIDVSGNVEFNSNLSVTGSDAHIVLSDETGNPADQSIRIRHEPIDLNLPEGAQSALIIEDNSPNNTPASIVVEAGVWSKNTPVAWVSFNGENGSIFHSFGISSVVREAEGSYRINLSNAMSSSDYPVFATQGGSSAVWATRVATGATYANRVSVRTANSSGVQADAPTVYVAVFGDRA